MHSSYWRVGLSDSHASSRFLPESKSTSLPPLPEALASALTEPLQPVVRESESAKRSTVPGSRRRPNEERREGRSSMRVWGEPAVTPPWFHPTAESGKFRHDRPSGVAPRGCPRGSLAGPEGSGGRDSAAEFVPQLFDQLLCFATELLGHQDLDQHVQVASATSVEARQPPPFDGQHRARLGTLGPLRPRPASRWVR